MHPEVEETIRLLQQAEDREGLDPFGFRPEMVGRVLPFTQWLYRHWFRVEVSGMEHIPAGRVLLIANHSGQLPYDGAMIATARADSGSILSTSTAIARGRSLSSAIANKPRPQNCPRKSSEAVQKKHSAAMVQLRRDGSLQ